MKAFAAVLPLVFMAFMELDDDKIPRAKIINEDRVHDMVMTRIGSGHVAFIERKDDDTLTVYDIYLTKSDTLLKVVFNGRTGGFEMFRLEPEHGHRLLQARMIAKTRAENAALAAVKGQVQRWKLKREGKRWFYRFRIETPKNEWKDVYIDKDSFEVKEVRAAKLNEQKDQDRQQSAAND